MKKILVINGNPKKDSLSDAIANTYCNKIKEQGAECKLIALRDLKFEYNVFVNNTKQEAEPDIVKVRQDILDAKHIMFVYPDWWGTYPALLKAFIDRTFVVGYAFEYQKGKVLPDKLLAGRSARVFVTMDTPKWYYRFFYGQPGHNSLKKSFMHFVGIRPVHFTVFTPIKHSTDETRAGYLKTVEKMAHKDLAKLQ